ncbi:MAG: hypothetical protein AAF587_08890 [Bacteroidota bacterium]
MNRNYLDGQQEYLESIGVLENGSPEEIRAAKAEFKKLYQKEYRRQRRASHPETTVTLPKDEWSYLSKEAKRHHLTLPKFLRKSSLAYLKQEYIVPNPQAVARIEQLLSLAQTDTLIIAKHLRQLGHETLAEAYDALSDRYTRLEQKLSQLLRQPSL